MTNFNKKFLKSPIDWWVSSLLWILPLTIQSWITSRRGKVEIWLGSQAVVLSPGGNPRDEGITISVDDVKNTEAIGSKIKNKISEVSIRPKLSIMYLPQEWVLNPVIETGLDNAGDISGLVKREIEKQTPFDPSEVYYNFEVVSANSEIDILSIRTNIARISDVDYALEVAKSAGLKHIIVCAEDAQDFVAENFVPEKDRVPATSPINWLIAGLVTISVFLGALSVYLPMENMRRVSNAAISELGLLKAESVRLTEMVHKNEQILDAHNGLLTRKHEQNNTIGILAEITKHTPEHSWFIQMQIGENDATMMGFSRNASDLMRALRQSELFEDVSFSAPVTRNGATDVDRVQLTAKFSQGDVR